MNRKDAAANALLYIDHAGHALHLPRRVQVPLCLAVDITVGWGHDCTDWASANRFHRWFHRWFWSAQ